MRLSAEEVNQNEELIQQTPAPLRNRSCSNHIYPPVSPISPYVDQDDLGLLEQKSFFAAGPVSSCALTVKPREPVRQSSKPRCKEEEPTSA